MLSKHNHYTDFMERGHFRSHFSCPQALPGFILSFGVVSFISVEVYLFSLRLECLSVLLLVNCISAAAILDLVFNILNHTVKRVHNLNLGNLLLLLSSHEAWRRLHNEQFHSLYRSPNMIRVIKSRRLKWAGQIARMEEGRSASKILTGTPTGKRPLGRPRRSWKGNIRIDLQEICINRRNWLDSAQGRDYFECGFHKPWS